MSWIKLVLSFHSFFCSRRLSAALAFATLPVISGFTSKYAEVSLRKQASKHQIVGRWRGRHLCTLRHPTDLSWCSKPIRHRGSIRWFRFLESSFPLDHTYVILRQHAACLWTASLWELQQLDTSKYEPTEILSWVSVYASLHISQNSVFTMSICTRDWKCLLSHLQTALVFWIVQLELCGMAPQRKPVLAFPLGFWGPFRRSASHL